MGLGIKFLIITALIIAGLLFVIYAVLIKENVLLAFISIVPALVARSLWLSYDNKKGGFALWVILLAMIAITSVVMALS